MHAQGLPPPSPEVAPAGAGWLVQDESSLRLLDSEGKTRAERRFRGEHLDTRVAGDTMLAVVLDADTQRALIFDIDLERLSLTERPALAIDAIAVETLCLYRDAQQLDHLFALGKDGRAEQWVLGESRHLQLRSLALPPDVEDCVVDDASGRMFVSEVDIGVWAYDIRGEGNPKRAPVSLRQPFGELRGDAGALALLPSGLAVIEDQARVQLLRESTSGWAAVSVTPAAAGDEVEQILTRRDAGGGWSLHMFDGSAWKQHTLAWQDVAIPPRLALPTVVARAQSEPVARLGDAADDPAIWVHPRDARRSRVLGTNKKQGLLVYDLAGRQLDLLEVGRLNNVDLRQRVRFGRERFDLAIATQRDESSLVVFAFDTEGALTEVHRIPTDLDDLYGLCLFAPAAGGLEVIANDKDGRFVQFGLHRDGGKWSGTLLRRFALDSQPEGCVADDARNRLFVGEEKRGVWMLDARGATRARPSLVQAVDDTLHADVEGMAILRRSPGDLLIVSSQGNDSYVVLDAVPPFRMRGAFRVGADVAAGIDGASETDGLEVTAANLGGPFESGMLVVQDGFKRMPDGPQNFKYIAWADIARALGLP